MSPCCGNGGNAILDAKRALGMIPRDTITTAELPNEVRLEYTGRFAGAVGFTVNGRTYYGATDELHRFINAPREDVEKLVSAGQWRIIMPPDEVRVSNQNNEDMQATMQAGVVNRANMPVRRG